MNRRTFLAATLLAVAAPRPALAVTPVAAPLAARRDVETIDPSPADPERIVARVDRLTGNSPPFPGNLDELVELGHFEYLGAIRGEYWVGELEAVPEPDALPSPAMAVDFASAAGIVGFREEHTLGMVEDAGVRWTIQASGGAREDRIRIVTDLALLLARRRSDATPTGPALEDLLPDPVDFPYPVRIVEDQSST